MPLKWIICMDVTFAHQFCCCDCFITGAATKLLFSDLLAHCHSFFSSEWWHLLLFIPRLLPFVLAVLLFAVTPPDRLGSGQRIRLPSSPPHHPRRRHFRLLGWHFASISFLLIFAGRRQIHTTPSFRGPADAGRRPSSFLRRHESGSHRSGKSARNCTGDCG